MYGKIIIGVDDGFAATMKPTTHNTYGSQILDLDQLYLQRVISSGIH